jgi:NAD(P)H-dependent FMN reductase
MTDQLSEGTLLVSQVRIAIVLGSTRPGRRGEPVARWVLEQASARGDAEFELLDLADFALPHLDEPMPPSSGQYEYEHTKKWSDAVDGFDGFVFVTPEYNRARRACSRTLSTTCTRSGTTKPPAS